jgi:hypothetical protein
MFYLWSSLPEDGLFKPKHIEGNVNYKMVQHILFVIKMQLPYFSIDNAHLMYNAHPKLFRHSFWCIDNARDAN